MRPTSKPVNDEILHGACPEFNDEILLGVYPEPVEEILHFVQNDKAKGSGLPFSLPD